MTTSTTALATIDKLCTDLDQIASSCSLTALNSLPSFKKALTIAGAIADLRNRITPEIMRQIMPLQNSSLGFRTDKTEGYSQDVVRDCMIEAVLRGLQPVGNEFNVISGRCYVTKEGFTRLLRDMPGLTDLRLTLSVPRPAGDRGAVVTASATWKMNGVGDSIEREIPVKVNSAMGADAILGKAERKLRASIYAQITGSAMSDGEADADAIETTGRRSTVPTSSAEDINAKLRAASVTQPAGRDDRMKILAEVNEICKTKFQAKSLSDVCKLAEEALGKSVKRQADILDSDLDNLVETLRQAPAPTIEETADAAA